MPPRRKDSSIVKQNIDVDQDASSSIKHSFPSSIKRGLPPLQEKEGGKQRRLALRVEQLTASICSAKQEIIFLKEALEAEKIEFEKNKMRQDSQPITPPVPYFLKLSYEHPSTQSFTIADQPHDPESTTVSLTWDSPISQYYKLDSYLPPSSSFQSTDYTGDEDVPMVDLDSIIYLDHLAA
ncbi:hypothetical protein Clacol_001331 [Clathrus columnatus]|uniref:Uncharacterized protein n=1 Tax=Clathrus columnatus TaxID=1419009 RepID=A0AAV5A3I3_9AGAM|nr:hypothetical protein Clacol_001331 [Clathrus columnatus]